MTKLHEMTWEARAIAAEKTVAVLKRKVQALYDGVERGIIDRQLEEARARAERMARRRELTEVRNQELLRHSQALESEVASRTRTIRTILDNVTFGFFLVAGDGRIANGATDSCRRLFGRDIVGLQLTQLLAADTDTAEGIEAALQQVFDDVLPEAVSLSLLPHQVAVGSRTLSIEGRVVRSSGHTVAQVLFSVSDISELLAARRENELNRCLVQALRQRNAFRTFVADAHEQLERAQTALTHGDQAWARRAVHTVKGNAACYSLREVVERCHAVEGLAHITVNDIASVARQLQQFLEQQHAVLGIDYHHCPDHNVALDQERIARLDAIAARLRDDELSRYVADLHLRPAADVLGPVGEAIERLAKRLDKEVELITSGLEVDIDLARYRGVLASITHLLRNAVDHGIERPEHRRGKPRKGQIELRVEPHPDRWEVSVRDDGRGIDRQRVVAAALAAGRITPEQARALSARQAIELVLDDGISTAAETTEISGRGVGLAAVKAAVEAAGATLEIESVPEHGCIFRLALPRR